MYWCSFSYPFWLCQVLIWRLSFGWGNPKMDLAQNNRQIKAKAQDLLAIQSLLTLFTSFSTFRQQFITFIMFLSLFFIECQCCHQFILKFSLRYLKIFLTFILRFSLYCFLFLIQFSEPNLFYYWKNVSILSKISYFKVNKNWKNSNMIIVDILLLDLYLLFWWFEDD